MNDEDDVSVNRGRHYPVEPQYFEFCEYGCLGDGHRLVWDPMTQTLEIRDREGFKSAKKLPTPTRGRTRGQAAPCEVTRLKVVKGREFRSA
jgi:hypothetical protein